MKRVLLSLVALFFCSSLLAQTPSHYYVAISTGHGDGVIKLFNETREHRDNFVKLVREGFYDSLLFHRVIENFMIQGGDPDSRYAASRQRLGEGGPDYKVPAEIQDSIIHKKGVIAAARDDNPAKASSASQFYLVQGRIFSAAALDSLETFRLNGGKLSAQQREVYSTIGGVPHLDGNYTVFGEMIEGAELIDLIAKEETDMYDRPLTDQRFSMKVLDRREALNLERMLEELPPKTGFFTKILDGIKARQYKLP